LEVIDDTVGIIVEDVGEFVDMGLLVEIDDLVGDEVEGDWEGSDVGANVGFFV
jgi:hypothetical protein